MSFSRTVTEKHLLSALMNLRLPKTWAVMIVCSGEGCSYRVP